jgi:hypothetical protein
VSVIFRFPILARSRHCNPPCQTRYPSHQRSHCIGCCERTVVRAGGLAPRRRLPVGVGRSSDLAQCPNLAHSGPPIARQIASFRANNCLAFALHSIISSATDHGYGATYIGRSTVQDGSIELVRLSACTRATCLLRAANCYPSQNARMASCNAFTLNRKASAAVSRPLNFVARAETLVL